MIIVYTGNGKGKTSAAIGQAIRAKGRGLSVAFAQFMKPMNVSGEQSILSYILSPNFYARGNPEWITKDNVELHKQPARDVLIWARGRRDCNMIILDEALYALDYKLITTTNLSPLLKWGKDVGILILTGRNAPKEIIDMAHIVSEIKEVKYSGDLTHEMLNGVGW